jgi:hypothetical protein
MFFDGDIVTWSKLPIEEGRERYSLIDISDDSVDLEDQFGDEPESFLVHEGDVVLDGSLVLTGGENTLYVIDGNLTVNGPVSFKNGDANTSLYVTGSVTVRSLICRWHSQFFVGNSLVVGDLLVTDLADAGHLVVHGSVSARAWLELAGRGAIYVDVSEATRLLGSNASCSYFGERKVESIPDALRPELIDVEQCVDRDQLEQAILEGRPVLR